MDDHAQSKHLQAPGDQPPCRLVPSAGARRQRPDQTTPQHTLLCQILPHLDTHLLAEASVGGGDAGASEKARRRSKTGKTPKQSDAAVAVAEGRRGSEEATRKDLRNRIVRFLGRLGGMCVQYISISLPMGRVCPCTSAVFVMSTVVQVKVICAGVQRDVFTPFQLCFHAKKHVQCMYGHTYCKSMDQPGKVANPARGQLNRKN